MELPMILGVPVLCNPMLADGYIKNGGDVIELSSNDYLTIQRNLLNRVWVREDTMIRAKKEVERVLKMYGGE